MSSESKANKFTFWEASAISFPAHTDFHLVSEVVRTLCGPSSTRPMRKARLGTMLRPEHPPPQRISGFHGRLDYFSFLVTTAEVGGAVALARPAAVTAAQLLNLCPKSGPVVKGRVERAATPPPAL